MMETSLQHQREFGFRRVRSFKINRSGVENGIKKFESLTAPSLRYADYGNYVPMIAYKRPMDRTPKFNYNRQRLMSESHSVSSPIPVARSFTHDGFENILSPSAMNKPRCKNDSALRSLSNRPASGSDVNIIAPDQDVFGLNGSGESNKDVSYSRRCYYNRTISWPSNEPNHPEADAISSNKRCTSDSEVLEPFQVIQEFKRKPPSFWLGCIYIFVPGSKKLELTIRQTGVLPDILAKHRFSKLSAVISLPGTSSQSVVLAKSKSDLSFRPHLMFFDAKDRTNVRKQGLEVKLYSHSKLFLKKCIAEWTIPLDRCTEETKTEWRKYSADN